MQDNKNKEVVLYLVGGGGHAAVIEDIAKRCNCHVEGVFFDGDIENKTSLKKIGEFGDVKNIKDNSCFMLAFGNLEARYRFVQENKLIWHSLIDPTAIISDNVEIGIGTVIMPGVIINNGAKIGDHVIINSGSIIEHGSVIGNHTHVAPGSVICGNVNIGDRTFIGAGSTIINAITIGNDVVIGAGSVVIKNIESNEKVVGVPAKKVLKRHG